MMAVQLSFLIGLCIGCIVPLLFVYYYCKDDCGCDKL